MLLGHLDFLARHVGYGNFLPMVMPKKLLDCQLPAIRTQITFVQIESPKTANRIKSPIASSQIESSGA